MSWISDIAGKAEEFLNKIDQNAAVVLKKDKQGKLDVQNGQRVNSHRIEIPSDNLESDKESQTALKVSNLMKISHSSPSFLNSNSSKPYPDLLDSLTLDTAKLDESVSSRSEDDYCISEDVRELKTENQMLRNEVRSLNGEISLLLGRVKESKQGCSSLEERVSQYELEHEAVQSELREACQRISLLEQQCSLLQSENDKIKLEFSESEQSRETEVENQLESFRKEASHKEAILRKENDQLQERLNASLSLVESTDKEKKLALRKSEEARLELEQYRARARSTLADKHRMIEQLIAMKNDTKVPEETLAHVKTTCEQNFEDWEAECEVLREKLEESRGETRQAEESLYTARKRISVLESEARQLEGSESKRCLELRSELDRARQELTSRVHKLNDKLSQKDSELRQLRNQLSARKVNSSVSEEGRISNLTSALVKKQAALEQATAETAQLRLQLERAKNKWREQSLLLHTGHANDTDDVKARVPEKSLDNPFDSRTWRRLKKLYTDIDVILGRATGVLLRTFPMARIVALFYLIILHLLLCMILYSRTPDTK